MATPFTGIGTVDSTKANTQHISTIGTSLLARRSSWGSPLATSEGWIDIVTNIWNKGKFTRYIWKTGSHFEDFWEVLDSSWEGVLKFLVPTQPFISASPGQSTVKEINFHSTFPEIRPRLPWSVYYYLSTQYTSKWIVFNWKLWQLRLSQGFW